MGISGLEFRTQEKEKRRPAGRGGIVSTASAAPIFLLLQNTALVTLH